MLHARVVYCALVAAAALSFATATASAQDPPPGDTPVFVTPDAEQDANVGGDCEPQTIVNYVPPRTTLSAVFYFPWHVGSADCPTSSDWCACFSERKPGHPRPVLGFYDSGNETTVGAHMDQMAQHGIDVMGVEFSGFGEREDVNFISAVLPAISSRNLKFVLLYDIKLRLGPGRVTMDFPPTFNKFVSDFGRFASEASYFSHPKYLKFNNKPVVYLYASRAIEGTDANVQNAFDQIHAAARNKGFADLYIVADHLFFGGVNYNQLSLMGAGAVSAFGPVTANPVPDPPVSQDDATRPVREWANRMVDRLYRPAVQGQLATVGPVDLTPGIFPQYDDTGTGPGEACYNGDPNRAESQRYHLLDVSDWSYMIEKAGLDQRWIAESTRVLRNCTQTRTTNTNYTSIVWTYSFNEWGEGTGIEPLDDRSPAYPYGFGFEPLQTLNGKLGAVGSSSLPPAPTPRNPSGTAQTLRPTFVWDGVQFGVDYNLRVFDASGQIVIDTTVADTSYRPGFDLAADQQHSWKVRGRNNVGWGAFSAKTYFTPIPPYTTPPDPPVPLGPSGCTASARPTFTWQPAARAADYKIEVFEESPVRLVLYQDVSGTSFTPALDLASVLHRWRVKGRNSIGETWSQNLYFTPQCRPSITIGDTAVTEDALGRDSSRPEVDSGTLSASFTVSLSQASSATISVHYATSDGSATAGTDYTAVSGTLTFPAGATTRTIDVPVLGDTLAEVDETFFVNLTSPTNSTIADGQGQGTIDDNEPPTFSIDDLEIEDGSAGTTSNAIFTVTRMGLASQTATVSYAMGKGSATGKADYMPTSGTLTFAPGVRTQTISVAVLGDDVPEQGNEYFSVNIGAATNATVVDGVGICTIVDDDGPLIL